MRHFKTLLVFADGERKAEFIPYDSSFNDALEDYVYMKIKNSAVRFIILLETASKKDYRLIWKRK